jgi:hypothetical protein
MRVAAMSWAPIGRSTAEASSAAAASRSAAAVAQPLCNALVHNLLLHRSGMAGVESARVDLEDLRQAATTAARAVDATMFCARPRPQLGCS